MGWQILGMLAVVTGIAVSIALHEVGHLLPAKKFGVRVSDYAIGFGPSLFSKRFGETTYALRAIPVGGYIRMIGMYPPASQSGGTGVFSRMAEEARQDALSEVLPSDNGRTFYEKPIAQRITIMLGGPTMNLLLAGLLFAVALVGVGLPAASTTVGTVSPCTLSNANPRGLVGTNGQCADGPSAAVRAGLKPGMTITAIDGIVVTDWQSLDAALTQAAKRNPTGTVTVLNADGSSRTLNIDFQVLTVDRYDASGVPTGEKYQRAVMGVLMQWQRQHLPVTIVPRVMWSMTTASVHSLASFPRKIWDLGATLIHGGTRDPNGPVSVVGATRIGGEIAASSADGWDKLVSLLMLLGSLNLFLFLFNLVPLLPLDGGHVAAAVWEVARNLLRRLRGHRANGPVDTARLLPLTYAMSTLLIAVGALVIWADIVKPITLGG